MYNRSRYTFKAFILHQPQYLFDLLHPVPQSVRRSANKNLLSVSFVKSGIGRILFTLFLLLLHFALPSKPFFFLNNFTFLLYTVIFLLNFFIYYFYNYISLFYNFTFSPKSSVQLFSLSPIQPTGCEMDSRIE